MLLQRDYRTHCLSISNYLNKTKKEEEEEEREFAPLVAAVYFLDQSRRTVKRTTVKTTYGSNVIKKMWILMRIIITKYVLSVKAVKKKKKHIHFLRGFLNYFFFFPHLSRLLHGHCWGWSMTTRLCVVVVVAIVVNHRTAHVISSAGEGGKKRERERKSTRNFSIYRTSWRSSSCLSCILWYLWCSCCCCGAVLKEGPAPCAKLCLLLSWWKYKK